MKKDQSYSLDIVGKQVMSKILSYQRCLNLAKNELRNRAYGAMFGFAIGDALGSYLVNQQPRIDSINEALLMRGGGALNLQAG